MSIKSELQQALKAVEDSKARMNKAQLQTTSDNHIRPLIRELEEVETRLKKAIANLSAA